jgi:decaprenylphospho-beta-D-erythro-pentofuranosid-2-ulose 2-reductase
MNVLFLGATRGMGRALARRMAQRGDRLFLVGRSEDELVRSTADLQAQTSTGDAIVGRALLDLAQPETFAPALTAAWSALDRVDCVVITAGLFGTQEQLEEDAELLRSVLTVNFAHTVLLCEQARVRLLEAGGGRLVVFTSVAGDRGRKPVGLYGSTKAGLSHYLESLDHKHRANGLVTINVKPGFVRTGMTAGLKPPPFAGEPDAVAQVVLRAIDRGTPVVYAPPIWRWVMTVIRALPRFVMRKVGF